MTIAETLAPKTIRPEKRTVAWCRDCKWHLPEYEIGGKCPASDCPRTLIKRVGWVCVVPVEYPLGPCGCIYWSFRAAQECQHDCY